MGFFIIRKLRDLYAFLLIMLGPKDSTIDPNPQTYYKEALVMYSGKKINLLYYTFFYEKVQRRGTL